MIYKSKHITLIRSSLLVIVLAFICNSCSIKKFIPDDELLYTGATLKLESDTTIKMRSQLKKELEKTYRPSPNTKFLGMYPGLYFHYKNQKEKPGFINRFLYKKIGEEPVYKSDVSPLEVEDLLENRLENRGFFYSRAGSEFVENEKAKTASVDYYVKVARPYLLENYTLDTLAPPIYKEMKSEVGSSAMKKGLRFDLSNMKLERDRIDYHLKRKGYYNFNPSLLIFEVDSNRYENRRFDMYLRMKRDVPQKAIIPYKIDEVKVYTDHQLDQDTSKMTTERFNNKNYVRQEINFKSKYLDPYITIEEGDFYDPDVSSNTSRRLGTLGTYKFINIQYKELDTIVDDSVGLLQANIYLSPLNRRAIRAQVQAVTKSNNFAGPGIGLTYTNRNLFKGGELLNISATGSYEIQAGGNSGNLSSIELGLGTELIVPRVLFPIKINTDFFKYSIPKTITSVGFDYLNRSKLYTLLSGNARFGYLWDANKYVRHEINPISLSYTRLSDTTPEFDTILEENAFLLSSFNQEFISGLTYSFTYNGMVDSKKTHQFFLNSTFDIAGNTVSLFGQENEDSSSDAQTFLGLEYAQYAKLDADARYHFKLGKDRTIATRIFAGYGYAYGNSKVLPFVKQYAAGGPYSVRAFRTRGLGPGTFNEDTDSDQNSSIAGRGFFEQTGNVRFEANAEYRFPIFNYLKGAFFMDAGNIWYTVQNDQVPNGKFGSDFLTELGIGGGFGLRVDVQGFVIRFDLAAPFHDPALPEGERWDFRFDEPILNFAIGYPF